jgi:predicted adenylyl cyclase CyaB
MRGELSGFDRTPEGPVEIERKFLVDGFEPESHSAEGVPITQCYIRVRGDTETRIRQKGDDYYFTVKSGSGLVRTELELPIAEQDYEGLRPLADGREVRKTRYDVACGQDVIEVDVYDGDLKGLVIAEAEFSSPENARLFMPLSWMTEEVTDDKRYKNQQLALHGPPRESHPGASVTELPLKDGLDALTKYAEILAKTSGRPIVCAVAGGSASGKTTAVAARLAEHFGDKALLISLDDYYRGVSYMKQRSDEIGRELNFDEPEAVDIELAAAQLAQLRDGVTIAKPVYDFKSGERSGVLTLRLEDRSIVIVEGLFALDEDIASAADITCFVNIETHGRIMRRLMRDLSRTSWSPGEIIKYFSVLEDMHHTYVQPTLKNADIVIDNSYDPTIEAQRSGMDEIQLKYPADIDPEALRKLGAELVAAPVRQVDTFYNPRGANLVDSDELVRIRETGESVTFGYKGPRLADEHVRRRPKIEFPIDPSLADGLKELYPDPVKKVIKQRCTFLVDGVLITLDEVSVEDVPGKRRELGKFIELRANSKEEIERLSRLLPVDPAAADKRSYFDM